MKSITIAFTWTLVMSACTSDATGSDATSSDATSSDETEADATSSDDGEPDGATIDTATSDEVESETQVPAPHFSEVYDLLGACTFCHGTRLPRGNFSLGEDSASAYQALVNHPASSDECADPPHTRVVPFHPEESLLYLKLAGTQTCGDSMPSPNGEIRPTPFTEEELGTIHDWIAAGALDD